MTDAVEDKKTSAVKTSTHDTFCAKCRVWYRRGVPCPRCKRSMLLG